MPPILRIALDTPLRQLFDYYPPAGPPAGLPAGVDGAGLSAGVRVRVPFGRRRAVGVLVEVAARSLLPPGKIKPALEILDQAPLLDEAWFAFVKWAAEYYHHPLGEVLASALPLQVREGKALLPVTADPRKITAVQAGPPLTAAQEQALAEIQASSMRFSAHLLHGVTGSGKTEVYLRAIEQTLALNRQALVLVPEIGLTPQLLERFRSRFDTPLAVMHSSLTHRARLLAWQQARSGEAAIVIGTRSAIFTPLARPGLIVVDEEHDASFKQQEGFRYSARDLAVVRAQHHGVPVILGSATPALESLANARSGRYQRLVLPDRPGAARPPQVRVVDLRQHAVQEGLATPTLASIDAHLRDGNQVLVYLNRRGYAPTLFCPGCGWMAPCRHCDARLTVHLKSRTLRCHHCGARQTLPFACPTCGQEVRPVGQGTERVEETLQQRFPETPLVRFDRDSVRRKGDMQAALDRVNSGEARLLLGTQMLTKGHHFPNVTLVVIVNADQGLFSADFRASERLAQTIVQVAGRAGRAERPGEVLIQTEFPQHPLLQSLLQGGYDGFAEAALQERAAARWPPYSRLALLRADAREAQSAMRFLEDAVAAAEPLNPQAHGVRLLGPAPATMARRAGYHRAQLLVESPQRAPLHRFLESWLPQIDALPTARAVRWSVDVDPADLY